MELGIMKWTTVDTAIVSRERERERLGERMVTRMVKWEISK
jgi:hypothetical protein